jgi:endoplasmic reticulum resident protein 44
VIKERFSHERGQINFIVADGNKFSHPLKHLGKSKADLPVLAFDTFKVFFLVFFVVFLVGPKSSCPLVMQHMHLFKKYNNIFKPGKLEQFVKDLHSGLFCQGGFFYIIFLVLQLVLL